MALAWLDFDYAEDEDGHGSFDAMAAAAPAQWPALEAEVVSVLQWAEASFGPPVPPDEGGEWDCELQGVREVATTLAIDFDASAGRLRQRDEATGAPRVTLSFTLTGSAAFCHAFRQRFL